MKKEPFLLSKKLNSIEGTNTAHTYLGKKVYGTSGNYVGRVVDVVLSNEMYVGLMVKSKRLLFIDKEYCEPETIDSIILKIDPITMLKQKLVFDSNGKKLGRVKSFERSNVHNSCDVIIVKKNMFKKPISIPYSAVETSKKNIILNKAY